MSVLPTGDSVVEGCDGGVMGFVNSAGCDAIRQCAFRRDRFPECQSRTRVGGPRPGCAEISPPKCQSGVGLEWSGEHHLLDRHLTFVAYPGEAFQRE